MLLILMVAGGGRWFDMGRFAESRQYWPEMAWNAMVEGRFDDPAVAMIYYQPSGLKPLVKYVREHHWGPAGEITSFARLKATNQSPRIDGYRSEPKACLGHWDRARRSGLTSVSVGGWALSQAPGQVARRVAFVTGPGKIIGYAGVNNVRQDVAGQYPSARNVKTGWDANLVLPGAGIYRAFLLFEDQRAACPIGVELRIRHFPVF
jgi:hypothetical protein